MSESYSNYSAFFNEIVESRNYALIKTILDSLELLPSYNQEQTEVIARKQLQGNDQQMIELFTDKFGMSSKAACEYIDARSLDLSLDRSQVDKIIPKLGSYYGSALASACLVGDLEMAGKIAEHYQYDPVVLSISKAPLGYLYKANDEVVSHNSKTMRNISAQELKQLMTLIHRVGLDGLLGINDRNFWAVLDTEAQAVTYEDELPSIGRDGLIENPELILAFEMEGKGKPYSNIYDRIPCWVHNDLLSSFASKNVYESKTLFHRDDPYSTQAPLDYDIHDLYTEPPIVVQERRGDDTPLAEAYGKITLGLEAVEKLPERLANTLPTEEYVEKFKRLYRDNTLLIEILPSAVALGLDNRPGYSLVVADIHEIRNYGIKSVNNEKLDRAVSYALNFLPRSLLTTKNGLLPDKKIPHVGLHKDYANALFTKALEGPAREKLLSVFPKRFWASMFKKCAFDLPPEVLVRAVKEWGFDNRHARLYKLTPAHIDHLHAAGFKAHPDGDVMAIDNYSTLKNSGFTFQHHLMFLQMGGWAYGDIEKPASIQEGMKLATRTKKHNYYDAYLVAQGPGAVVEVAKTPAQWQLVKNLFSTQELIPFAGKIPAQERASLLEDSLGM